MPVDVTTFSALARSEFQAGMMAALDKPFPADFELFSTTLPSTTAVETHTYMSNLPRLSEFTGASESVQLIDSTYTVKNKTYRAGPVLVKKENLDDDQQGGYLKTINALPTRAQKDIGHKMLSHLALGTTTACFDGSNFFADSHNFGSGDNNDTANFASNDAVTHRIIALVTDNSAVKPVVFQNREPLSGLMTDADTPQAAELRQYKYWADTRFGLGYGYWWDAYNVAITDTPTVAEVVETLIPQIINGFRSFTLPKGKATDDTLYVHGNWKPSPASFVLVCSLKLAEIVETAITLSQYIRSTGNVDNVYKGKATVIASPELGA